MRLSHPVSLADVHCRWSSEALSADFARRAAEVLDACRGRGWPRGCSRQSVPCRAVALVLARRVLLVSPSAAVERSCAAAVEQVASPSPGAAETEEAEPGRERERTGGREERIRGEGMRRLHGSRRHPRGHTARTAEACATAGEQWGQLGAGESSVAGLNREGGALRVAGASRVEPTRRAPSIRSRPARSENAVSSRL